MRNLTSSQKLWGVLILAWLAMLLISLEGAWEKRRIMTQERQEQARLQTEGMAALLGDLAGRVSRGELDSAGAQRLARDSIRAIRYDEGRGYFFVFDKELRVVSHPSFEQGKSLADFRDADGRQLFADMRNQTDRAGGQAFVDYRWAAAGSDEAEDKRSYLRAFPEWGWYVGTGVYISDIDRAFRASLIGSVVALLVIGGLLTLVVGWIIRDLSRSLGGDPRYAAEVVRRVADGDLTAHPRLQPGDETSLLAAISRMCQRLSGTVGDIQRGADDVNAAAHEFNAGNVELASRTEQQAAALAETAATMEQLTATVRQNAENADQARSLAATCADDARRGGGAMGQVVSSMQAIQQSASQMATIVDTIDSIAFQTNILALNASVEAARAGEQGRGFAVVAGEVRKLASRSADAAHEIKDLINSASEQIKGGNLRVHETGEMIQGVVDDMMRLNTLIAEISSASHEQSSGIEQINIAVSEMDQMTQRNAGLVQKAANGATALVAQAESLENAVAVFKVDQAAVRPAAARPAPSRPAPAPAPAQPAQAQARSGAAPRTVAGAQRPASRSDEQEWSEF